MSELNLNSLVTLRDLQAEAQRAAAAISTVNTSATTALRSMAVANGTVSFYTSADASGTAAYSFNFPSELVLDQLHTTFESDFEFSAGTYTGATDPNLDGKPVLVIAIKETTSAGATTTTYSFLDMTTLVDAYTAGNASININGYEISVRISAAAGNHLALGADGLMVDVSDKADKVANATAGDIASLDANGNLVDSGVVASNVLQKIANATADNLVTLNADGTIKDAGYSVASAADVSSMLDSVWGTGA